MLTRGFFLLPTREWPLPSWLLKGLRYAPLAALLAVIAPEIVLTDGMLIDTWRDARLYSVAVGTAWLPAAGSSDSAPSARAGGGS
mgnify:CR=1 FL=1